MPVSRVYVIRRRRDGYRGGKATVVLTATHGAAYRHECRWTFLHQGEGVELKKTLPTQQSKPPSILCDHVNNPAYICTELHAGPHTVMGVGLGQMQKW